MQHFSKCNLQNKFSHSGFVFFDIKHNYLWSIFWYFCKINYITVHSGLHLLPKTIDLSPLHPWHNDVNWNGLKMLKCLMHTLQASLVVLKWGNDFMQTQPATWVSLSISCIRCKKSEFQLSGRQLCLEIQHEDTAFLPIPHPSSNSHASA